MYNVALQINLAHVHLSMGQLALAREAAAKAQVYKLTKFSLVN